MCTYLTEKIEAVDSSAKGALGWLPLSHATVYYDHPVHAQAEHTLNIDFLSAAAGPSGRVAVELSLETAAALVAAIQTTLAQAAAFSTAGG